MSALKPLMRWQVNTHEPMWFGVGTDWGKRPRRGGRSQEVQCLQWPERRQRLMGVSGSSGLQLITLQAGPGTQIFWSMSQATEQYATPALAAGSALSCAGAGRVREASIVLERTALSFPLSNRSELQKTDRGRHEPPGRTAAGSFKSEYLIYFQARSQNPGQGRTDAVPELPVHPLVTEVVLDRRPSAHQRSPGVPACVAARLRGLHQVL